MKKSGLFLLIGILFILTTGAQESHRFRKEVVEVTAGDSTYKSTSFILFTGSSTIRMWKSLPEDFAGKPVVNHGFGGSEMSDLLYFSTELILKYKPRQIFIYEGDNDINSSKTTAQILSSADSLIKAIRKFLPATPIYFISAKPSKARWHLKDKYLEYNTALKNFASKQKEVYFIDLWKPMMDKSGVVQQDIFIEDGLHMNDKGYAIWKKVIGPYLK